MNTVQIAPEIVTRPTLGKFDEEVFMRTALIHEKDGIAPLFTRDGQMVLEVQEYSRMLIGNIIASGGHGEIISVGKAREVSLYYHRLDDPSFMEIVVKGTARPKQQTRASQRLFYLRGHEQTSPDAIFVCICVESNELWMFRGDELTKRRKELRLKLDSDSLSIGCSANASQKWTSFSVNLNEIATRIDTYYGIAKANNQTLTLDGSVAIFRRKKTEPLYKGLSRLALLPAFRWENPPLDNCPCDMLMENLKLIERTASVTATDWSVDISRLTGLNYALNDFHLLWVNFPEPKNNLFLLIPAIVLQDHGYLRTNGYPGESLLTFSDSPDMLAYYTFDYDDTMIRYDITQMLNRIKSHDLDREWTHDFRYIGEVPKRLIIGSSIKSLNELYTAERLEHDLLITPQIKTIHENLGNHVMERYGAVKVMQSTNRIGIGLIHILNDGCLADSMYKRKMAEKGIRLQLKTTSGFRKFEDRSRCRFSEVKRYEGCVMLFLAIEVGIVWGMTHKELCTILQG